LDFDTLSDGTIWATVDPTINESDDTTEDPGNLHVVVLELMDGKVSYLFMLKLL
jgi:hypothetical protein